MYCVFDNLRVDDHRALSVEPFFKSGHLYQHCFLLGACSLGSTQAVCGYFIDLNILTSCLKSLTL